MAGERIFQLVDESLAQLEILHEMLVARGKWLDENCEPLPQEQEVL